MQGAPGDIKLFLVSAGERKINSLSTIDVFFTVSLISSFQLNFKVFLSLSIYFLMYFHILFLSRIFAVSLNLIIEFSHSVAQVIEDV